MKSVILICCLALALQACGGGRPVEPKPEVLGVRLGMSRDEAHKRLTEIGRLEKEERKRQEVWALTNNPTYSHLIVSYTEGYKALRFVTAVAKEGGQRVRYEDVMDVKNAQRNQAQQTVTRRRDRIRLCFR